MQFASCSLMNIGFQSSSETKSDTSRPSLEHADLIVSSTYLYWKIMKITIWLNSEQSPVNLCFQFSGKGVWILLADRHAHNENLLLIEYEQLLIEYNHENLLLNSSVKYCCY